MLLSIYQISKILVWLWLGLGHCWGLHEIGCRINTLIFLNS